MKHFTAALLIAAAPLAVPAHAAPAKAAPAQQAYASPQDAAKAHAEALRSRDRKAALAVVGPILDYVLDQLDGAGHL